MTINLRYLYLKAIVVMVLMGVSVVQGQDVNASSVYETRMKAFLKDATFVSAADGGASDYIVALVNNDIVTNQELRVRYQNALKATPGGSVPNERMPAFLMQLMDEAVFDRLQAQAAKEAGIVIDERTVDGAVGQIAKQNGLSVSQLRDRLATEGVSYEDLRQRVYSQLFNQRVRERFSDVRGRVSDYEIESEITRHTKSVLPPPIDINVAQILIEVPEEANPALVAERLALANTIAEKARKGADFSALANETRVDSSVDDAKGMGLKGQERYPTLFVDAVKGLKPGQVAGPVKSGAGYHVLKLLERREPVLGDLRVTETHPRHILIRAEAPAEQAQAIADLKKLRDAIVSGKTSFEDAAKAISADSSAEVGGDLGWIGPAQFVPEFERPMAKLPIGEISDPVVSRFGVHLIQVLERRDSTIKRDQLRDRVSSVLRQSRSEEAYKAWAKDLRDSAYIEWREAPKF